MIRRALIIFCDDTDSGSLSGPVADNNNLRKHLTSQLGGEWYGSEILSLNNPTKRQVLQAMRNHINEADYSFIIFSGHGFINTDDNNEQYIELQDESISINILVNSCRRQTLIIDACRGYYSEKRLFSKGLTGVFDSHKPRTSTRKLFNHHLNNCEEGLSILYAASENQTAIDSNQGGAYLFSILKACELWSQHDTKRQKFSIKDAHNNGTIFMHKNFKTIQKPVMQPEKRMRYFPLAVKWIPL